MLNSNTIMNTKKVKQNILTIGGVKTTDLVKQFATPLFVYDQKQIESKMDLYKQNFKSKKLNTEILYASKAFSCLAIYQLCQKYALGIDAVSYGELYTALEASVNPRSIFLHGNNKTKAELELSVKNKIGCIVIDDIRDVHLLKEIMPLYNHSMNVIIRVNPGIEVHTHEFIQTANLTSKFGVSIFDEPKVLELIHQIEKIAHLNFKGFHCHIGSQIFDGNAFLRATDAMLNFVASIQKEISTKIEWLNIGGGFGIQYTDEDQPDALVTTLQNIINFSENEIEKRNLFIDTLIIEPGRSIVGESGTTLYTVGGKKETYGGENYLFVDGGMTDNIRPALYGAKYDACIANRLNEEKEIRTIAGKCCESGDILIKDCAIEKSTSGDILAVFSTGAYGYSMSNHYNKHPKAAVVFVKDGQSQLVIERETVEDLIKNEKRISLND